jgi:hypothetical protein
MDSTQAASPINGRAERQQGLAIGQRSGAGMAFRFGTAKIRQSMALQAPFTSGVNKRSIGLTRVEKSRVGLHVQSYESGVLERGVAGRLVGVEQRFFRHSHAQNAGKKHRGYRGYAANGTEQRDNRRCLAGDRRPLLRGAAVTLQH